MKTNQSDNKSQATSSESTQVGLSRDLSLFSVTMIGVGAMFFLIGVYGGFVQAGVGFLILAATTAAGLSEPERT